MNKTKWLGLASALLVVAGGLLWTSLSSSAQGVAAAKTVAGTLPVSEFPLGENGLYFAGKRGRDYAFGPRITPHGDCITAIPGYVFVSWYKAPRSDRHLMVSRLNLATGVWKHVELPERNTTGHNFRCPDNPDGCGESHRTAAVEVCPIDETVHLMFDMHANDLQYIVSQPGTATLPDAEFVAARFNPKQNGLVAGKKLDARVTYPNFERNEKGEVFALWREGGSGNGNMVSATYDGKAWSKPYMTWFGKYDDPKKNVSIYGDEKYLNGRMYSGFSIRTPATPIELNQGLYFAEGGQKLSDDWIDLKGQKHKIPISDYAPFMIDEPVPNNDYRMSSGPSWTVSEHGDVHMIMDFATNKPALHYYRPDYRPAGAKAFIKSINPEAPGGELYAVGDRIFSLGLSKGQLEIASTPAGKDEWRKVGAAKTPKLAFGNSIEQDGVLYFFAMEDVGNPESQSLTVLALDLKKLG